MEYLELIYLLKTATLVEEIDERREDIALLIPKVRIMFNFNQQNHAHLYDLWYHSLYTVLNLPRNLDDDMLYLAALLHDIGKPEAQCTKDGDINKHYYGHAEISERIVAEEIAYNLGVSLCFDDIRRLLYYVRHHDDRVSLRLKHTRRHLELTTLENFRKLMLLEIADAKAHILLPIIQERIDICQKLYDEVAYNNYQRILNGE